MHIEFIDLLRCPSDHEESWLVAAFYRMDGRVVIEGKLGCPVCGAEYFIRNGIAVFDETHGLSRGSAVGADTDGTAIAAMLNLARPGMLALLAGEWARNVDELPQLTGARMIALNSPSPSRDSDAVAEIHAGLPIPIAAHSLDGIALDATHATPALLAEAARLLRPRGRLLMRGSAQLSDAFHELARDTDQVVAEYVGELVSLRR